MFVIIINNVHQIDRPLENILRLFFPLFTAPWFTFTRFSGSRGELMLSLWEEVTIQWLSSQIPR